jgi:hypothetical protein
MNCLFFFFFSSFKSTLEVMDDFTEYSLNIKYVRMLWFLIESWSRHGLFFFLIKDINWLDDACKDGTVRSSSEFWTVRIQKIYSIFSPMNTWINGSTCLVEMHVIGVDSHYKNLNKTNAASLGNPILKLLLFNAVFFFFIGKCCKWLNYHGRWSWILPKYRVEPTKKKKKQVILEGANKLCSMCFTEQRLGTEYMKTVS